MKLILGVALLGLALASQLPRLNTQWFESGREYVWKWDSQLTNGLSVTPSGQSLQRASAKVHLQLGDRDSVIQLRDLRFFTINKQLSHPESLVPERALEQLELTEEHRDLLALPVFFRYENGVVSDIRFDRSEPEWIRNIKRSVLNMLQINIRPVELAEKNSDNTDKFYRVKENVIEGNCEVSYTSVDGSESNEMHFTKSINFDKCTTRPDIRYGLRFGEECKECTEPQMNSYEPNQESQTVMRFRVRNSEERFLIREVELTSKYVFAPLKAELQMISTQIVNKLTLLESGDIKTRIPKIEADKMTTLVYGQRQHIAREMWEMTGEEKYLRESFPETTIDKVRSVKKIFENINEMYTEKNGFEIESNHMFARLVDILRRCTIKELEEIHTITEDNEKLRQIFFDAIATAGTKTCVSYIVTLIKNEEVSPNRAAYLIKTLVNLRLPSEKIIDTLLHLQKEPVCQRNPALLQTVRLTVGALINGLCGHHGDKWAVDRAEMCPREIKTKYVQILKKQFEEARDRYEKVLVLKTIANAGVDVSVHMLEKIIYDKNAERIVRMQAIDALRQLRNIMPRKIQAVLMPIYKKHNEVPEIRMNALFHIVHTQPERVVLEQIAEQINKERNAQVAVYTIRLLKSFVKSENPCEKTFSGRVKVALRLINEKNMNLASTYRHFSVYSDEWMTGASIDMSALFTNESVVPKELMASIDSILGSEWNKHLVQVGFSQQGIDKVLRNVLSKVENMKNIEDVIVRGKRSVLSRPMDMLRDLIQKVNIVTRRHSESEQEPHALVYLRYKNYDYAVIPMDEELVFNMLKNVVSGGRFDLSEIEEILARGFNFNFATGLYGYEMTRVVPTTFGLPLVLSAKVPIVSSIEGRIRAEIEPKNGRKIEGLRIHLTIKPTLAATHISHVQIMSPIVHTGMKLQNSVQFNLPIDTVTEMTWNKKISMNVVFKALKDEKRIVRLETRPVTFVRVFERDNSLYAEPTEKTVFTEKFDRYNKEIDTTFGDDLLGFEFSLTGNVYSAVSNVKSLPMLVSAKVLEVRALPTAETPSEYKVTFDLEMFLKERVNELPKFDKFYERNMDSFTVEKSDLIEEDETERREYLKNFRPEEAFGHRLRIRAETVGKRASEKKAEVELRTICDQEMRVCKVAINMLRSPVMGERRDWELKTTVDVMMPERATSLKELMKKVHREMHATLYAEWGCERKQTLNLKLQGEQNREMKNWMKLALNDNEEYYGLLEEAGELNQYKLAAEYDLNSNTEMYMQRLFSIVKMYTFWKNDVERVQKPENKLFVQLTIEPETRYFANLTIETPIQRLIVKDMRLPYRLPLVNIIKMSDVSERRVHEYGRAVCEVRSTKVRTFDELTYKTPITTCYSVIAKDCSEEPTFAVLLKKLTKLGEEKKVKIVAEERVIELQLIDEIMEVKINNKVHKESQLENHNIRKISENLYKIVLDQATIIFDGYTAKVELSHLMQNRQCGLCGHFDGQSDNEFRRADNIETEDLEEFHRSFLVRDNEECEVEEQKLSEKKHYKVIERESSSEEVNIFDEIEENDRKKARVARDGEPVLRTRVIEYTHRVCFSKKPVPECVNSETDETEQVKARFVCFDRNAPETKKYTRMVRHQSLDLSAEKDSFIHPITVAKTCEAY